MLKKLKIKFILNNMMLIGIVMLAIFTALCLLIYVSEENKLSVELKENMHKAEAEFLGTQTLPFEPSDRVYDHSFTVLVDRHGKVIRKTTTVSDENLINKATAFAIDHEYDRGNIGHMNLSFIKKEAPDGILISFLSREHLKARMGETVGHTLLAGFVSLLSFLYISNHLADIAIKPVKEAWDQQKQFLADASHDLKTPLTVILANNKILSAHRDESVESQMKWIESTAEEAGRMSDLVNKMLELAKSEEARDELRFGEIDLSEVVENSILQFEVVAFEKNLTIESGIQPNIIVKTHASTFSKILEILFDNAIKYSDDGGKISVALYQSSKKVYFTINNQGEYIKPDEIPHVFERFYRTNKERMVGGHGLGLSLAKKKCDMLRAKIAVESNPEDGTTFTITLKGKK